MSRWYNNKIVFSRKQKWLVASLFIIIALILFWNCLPKPLFREKASTVLVDRNGQLLGALVANDGQWRFPYNKDISVKFKKAIVRFEDKRFYHHPGVDIMALGRAFLKDIRSHKVKSGGSTLSMQVIRLSRSGRPRTFLNKIIEIIMALRLELSYSKEEILALYASHAPYGGNVIGLDAAAWRYFGKAQDQLSWGETATLAVLPNSPSLVHPGKNLLILKRKRDKLLDKLCAAGEIDAITCMSAKAEPLPDKPLALPQYAPHLLTRVFNENGRNKKADGMVARTTIDRTLQMEVENILGRHHRELKSNGINNAAALVADVETGDVLAYIGNIYDPQEPEFNGDVDVITAPRSTGSILKPFLFASMLSEGDILTTTLVPDIPTQIAGYTPLNFSKEFDGAVSAKRALERSLNIPAVRMLRSYGTEKFNYQLKKIGMTTLLHPADHYGLSIILGGAEGSMWDIAGMYASMARTLVHFGPYKARYDKSDFHPLNYHLSKEKKSPRPASFDNSSVLSAASIWCTFNAMEEVSRPDMESSWREFTSSQRVAWKTGTSFGFRDAWAVGCTPRYVVIVWAGNADGEGRPGLIGVAAAAPIMFDIFKLLKSSAWFDQPYEEMQQVDICRQSGHRALDICEDRDTMWIPIAGLKTPPCPYHQIVHLDMSGRYRVSSECESPSRMTHQSWFVLPPGQEWYYKSRNPQYRVLPPYRSDCSPTNKNAAMEFIYPKHSTKIYVPIELDGQTGKTVFEAAHRATDAVIYWHLDEEYLGSTKGTHQMALSPEPGKHVITLVDQQGERLELFFEVLQKAKK
jgi:penicillin-binding protein 1C